MDEDKNKTKIMYSKESRTKTATKWKLNPDSVALQRFSSLCRKNNELHLEATTTTTTVHAQSQPPLAIKKSILDSLPSFAFLCFEKSSSHSNQNPFPSNTIFN